VRYLVAIDDTDNLESRGTGFRSRQLCDAIGASEIGRGLGVTRHQLLVDPRIPYTSHNSAACLEVEAPDGAAAELFALGRDFLLRESAPGSDAGLAVIGAGAVPAAVREFGMRAKQEVLTREEAEEVAAAAGILRDGLTGTGGGVIGAVAAVGLRAAGNDGRYLWLPGLRELGGVHTVAELRAKASIAEVRDLRDAAVSDAELVDVGDWPRPILLEGRAVLLVEEAEDDDCGWRSAPRDLVKRRSD
jgi:hypothetical protein